nr:hypothetical protein Iba_chr13dCG7920 [Ipomoea batatas]
MPTPGLLSTVAPNSCEERIDYEPSQDKEEEEIKLQMLKLASVPTSVAVDQAANTEATIPAPEATIVEIGADQLDDRDLVEGDRNVKVDSDDVGFNDGAKADGGFEVDKSANERAARHGGRTSKNMVEQIVQQIRTHSQLQCVFRALALRRRREG